ncbi:winged helix-turn-helix domain-containing protein [Photobacterium indicum]|uniref:OmpR/PhoB-type domain-containing protein n=1 Tax=Photobacterium indicum TaxID=81447 RepID=A0A2T3LD26_9GAMM|nr:winged helix-turn-helix domain-containing protein [Photobacterium indicum]PSV49283.1 hypothetical protein C9J47_01580 [Photobacterium indicum]
MWIFHPHQREQLHNSKLNVYKRIKSTDCQILKLLVKHQGQLVSKDVLNNNAWEDRIVSDASLTQAIAQLRLTLGDSGKEQKIIKTLPRKGYMLIEGHVVFSDDYDKTAKSTTSTSLSQNEVKVHVKTEDDNKTEAKIIQNIHFLYQLNWWRRMNVFFILIILLFASFFYYRLGNVMIQRWSLEPNTWNITDVGGTTYHYDNHGGSEILYKQVVSKLNQHITDLFISKNPGQFYVSCIYRCVKLNEQSVKNLSFSMDYSFLDMRNIINEQCR